MQTIKFIAFKGKSVTSFLIRFWTRSSKYSHVGYTSDEHGIIEVWPDKEHGSLDMRWHFSALAEHTKGTYYEVWELVVSDSEFEDIESYFYQLALRKAKYDWLGIIGFLFPSVRDSKKGLFCSEGCLKRLAELKLWYTITAAHRSPNDFINIIQAAGAKKLKEGIV